MAPMNAGGRTASMPAGGILPRHAPANPPPPRRRPPRAAPAHARQRLPVVLSQRLRVRSPGGYPGGRAPYGYPSSGYGYGGAYDPYHHRHDPPRRGACRGCRPDDRDDGRVDDRDRAHPLGAEQHREWREMRTEQKQDWRALQRQQQEERRRLREAGAWDPAERQRQSEERRAVTREQKSERREMRSGHHEERRDYERGERD
jgi:hypothetical protein